MKNKPYWFRFNVEKWISGTYYLSHTAQACYLRLLLYQFEHGHIPVTKTERMEVCGITDVCQWDAIWGRLEPKFQPLETEDGIAFANPTMAEERDRALRTYTQRVEASRKGGAKTRDNLQGRTALGSEGRTALGSAPRTHGRTGGRSDSRTSSSFFKGEHSESRASATPDDQQNDKEKQDNKDKPKDKPKPKPKPKPGSNVPPTEDETREFVKKHNLVVDCAKWIDYHEQQGWCLANGRRMRNWHASLRNWHRRDAQQAKPSKTESQIRWEQTEERRRMLELDKRRKAAEQSRADAEEARKRSAGTGIAMELGLNFKGVGE